MAATSAALKASCLLQTAHETEGLLGSGAVPQDHLAEVQAWVAELKQDAAHLEAIAERYAAEFIQGLPGWCFNELGPDLAPALISWAIQVTNGERQVCFVN